MARYQVREDSHGEWTVWDTKREWVSSRSYRRLGWAVRKAIQLNEASKNFKYV